MTEVNFDFDDFNIPQRKLWKYLLEAMWGLREAGGWIMLGGWDTVTERECYQRVFLPTQVLTYQCYGRTERWGDQCSLACWIPGKDGKGDEVAWVLQQEQLLEIYVDSTFSCIATLYDSKGKRDYIGRDWNYVPRLQFSRPTSGDYTEFNLPGGISRLFMTLEAR